MSRPARIMALTTVVVSALIGAWLWLGPSLEPYGVLYSQLDRDDAAAIAAKLKEMKEPYRVGSDGATIEVPESQVHELRLSLASEGLPRGGGMGFESFENLRLGATEFEQQVTYRRAMEGELARTVATVGGVQSARVHLVFPEKSVFTTRDQPASASVVVKLVGGRTLGADEVGGIVHVVSSAVSGLTPERVALVTTDGTMLHRPKTGAGAESAALDAEQLSQTRNLEASLETRARTLLEQVLGEGHVDVRVSAELDMSRTERTEDRYEPSRTALRSEEQLVERTTATDGDVAGVPGAESNVPTGDGDDFEEANVEAGVLRKTHTRNWEIDHIAEKRVSASGTVKRLTVAVVIDGLANEAGDVVPRSQEELDKLAGLVRGALGVNDVRGDVVTIESVPFLTETPSEDGMVEGPDELIPASVTKFWPVAVAAMALVLFMSLLMTIRSVRRASAKAAEKRERAQLTDGGRRGAPQLEPAPMAAVLSDREEALRRAAADPATAALVMRQWLGMTDESAQGQH